jgi:hypothetical protein
MLETSPRFYSELEPGVEVGSVHTVLALALAALDLAGVVPEVRLVLAAPLQPAAKAAAKSIQSTRRGTRTGSAPAALCSPETQSCQCAPCDAVEPRRPRRGVLAHGLRYQLPSSACAGASASIRLPLLATADDSELLVECGDLAARTRRGGGSTGGGGRVGGVAVPPLLRGRRGGARRRLGLDGGHRRVSVTLGFANLQVLA